MTAPPTGRIDVHGHLLPGLDDGSTSYAESLDIAREMVRAGYSHLTCSPHIWPGHDYSPTFILERVAALQSKIDAEAIPIRLIAGAELNLVNVDIFQLADADIQTYGMAGKYVLFDFWAGELPRDYFQRVERFQRAGITPIQAHPERIACFQDHPGLVDDLRDHGVLLQGNLQCLSDKAGARTRTCIERWLDQDRYFMLGSDLHRLDTLQLRLLGLQNAKALLGDAILNRLTITHPAIVTGVTPQEPKTPSHTPKIEHPPRKTQRVL